MDRLILQLGALVSLGFLAIVAMMVYEVVARYGFNAPTFWAHEIAGLLAAFAFLIGGAYCMVDKSHMRITLLTERTRPSFRRVAELIALLCGIIYIAGLGYSAWGLTDKSLIRFLEDGSWAPERSGTSWNTPMPAFIKGALLIACLLFLAVLLRDLWRYFRLGKGTDPQGTGPQGTGPQGTDPRGTDPRGRA